jgi:hypothetical protein
MEAKTEDSRIDFKGEFPLSCGVVMESSKAGIESRWPREFSFASSRMPEE